MAQQTINNGETGLVVRTKINENFTELYGRSTSRIQNAAGNVFVDTEHVSYAGQTVFQSTNLGTNLIGQFFSSTTPVFQIDGNGGLYNDSIQWFQKISTGTYIFGNGATLTGTGDNNLFVGGNKGAAWTTGFSNVLIGPYAGNAISTGFQNSILGDLAALNLAAGAYNTLIGSRSGYQVKGGDYNTGLGYQSGYNINGGNNNTYLGAYSGLDASAKSGNVRIGYYAGKYTNTSNQYFLDNQDRINTATELTDSLIVGTFNASVTLQELFWNAQRISLRYIPIAAGGLTAGDIYRNGTNLEIV